MRYVVNRILLLVSFCLVLLSSCDDKSVDVVLQKITPSVDTITFEGVAAGQSQTVTFHSPEEWIAEIHSISSWLKADVLHGEAGDVHITLSPRSDNFSASVREAELQILADGCEPCSVHVLQRSASTGDIQVEGLGEDGVMTLQADETGLVFCDTLWINSSKRWSLSAADDDALSFVLSEEPLQGVQKRIQLIVTVPYAKFSDTSFEGKFYIMDGEGSAVPVTVNASAFVQVFEQEYGTSEDTECVSYNLTNNVQVGVFNTDFYVESNTRWSVGSVPDWTETSVPVASLNNVLSNGNINPMRQHLSFRVKDGALSRDGKTGTVILVDSQGRTVKTIYLTFAGVGANYIDNRLTLPSLDPLGNPFGFESKASNIDAGNPEDAWKQVRREFEVITSTDFTSLGNAPFHLLLVRADNGIPRHQEAHWASLEYVARNNSAMQGLYSHTMAIRVSDRGDADDQNGMSDETTWRYALAILVPRNVLFDDIWESDGTLREKYANVAVLLAQKNNADADYKFGFQEVKDGGTLTVPAKGGSLILNITPGSYTQCDILLEQQNQAGEWMSLNNGVCQMDIAMDEHQEPKSLIFTLSRNKGEENPFTHVVVGSDRHIRVSVLAFIGEAEGSRPIFTFYIDQALDK